MPAARRAAIPARPSAPRCRRGLRPGALVRRGALVVLLLVAGAGPGLAHAILMGSEPAVQGSVAAGVVPLTLRYNSRVDHGRSSLVLTRPDRSTERLPIAAGSAVDALDSTATLAPGSYSLRWQVLATDGHITRGDVPFAVVAPGGAPGAAVRAAPGVTAGAAPVGAGAVPAAITASAGAAAGPAEAAGPSGAVPARVAAAPATPGH